MECRYCKETAKVYAVLTNGIKLNVCDTHKKVSESNGVAKFEAI